MHGWPDDSFLWRKQIAFFKSKYTCVRFTLPHFSGRDAATKAGANSWGYSFPELADLIAGELEHLKIKVITLFVHDWGAVVGFTLQLRRPALVQRIVALDVGPPLVASWIDLPKIFIVGLIYQYSLITAFFVAKLGPPGRWIGDAIARGYAYFFKTSGIDGSTCQAMYLPSFLIIMCYIKTKLLSQQQFFECV